jgi:spore coat protein A, manganese oxidase
VAEFFGDTMLANGVVYPFHNVDQKTYRFRLLNACNARWLDLSFVQEDGTTGEPLFKGRGQPVPANVDVTQIGTEGGFLRKPVPLVTGGVPNQPFFLGPAERADILVTFNAPGNVILYNVAGSPFPGGAPIFDWYPGNRNLPVQPAAGYGPNTRTILRFAVSATRGPRIKAPKDIPVPSIPTEPDPVNGGFRVNAKRFAEQFPGFAYDPNQVPESLTLNEVVEPTDFTGTNTGRLLTLIGNPAATGALPFGAGGIYYTEPPTESVQYNTLRIWHVYNFTADAHPMHFHLFNVQILGRRKVNNAGVPTGMAAFPLPNEMGFKETVTMYPGEVTIVAALVEDPLPTSAGYGRDLDSDTGLQRPTVPVTVQIADINVTVPSMLPVSPRLKGFGLKADEYVWHCHILEHEEHDMMRPLVASD